MVASKFRPIEELRSFMPGKLSFLNLGKNAAEPPQLLTRSDGHGLFYRAKLNVLFGQSESGKTWLALFAAMQEMEKGNPVVMFDFEDDSLNAEERLLALGCDPGMLDELFWYSEVQDPMLAEMPAVLDALSDIKPSLIIFDSMDELLAMHAFNPNQSDDVRKARQQIIDPTMDETEAGVIVIDHVGKSDKKSQIGSSAKLTQLNGASLLVESKVPFGRGSQRGTATLTVQKDRRGHVRKLRPGKAPVALVDFASHENGHLEVQLNAPNLVEGNRQLYTAVIDRLVNVVDQNGTIMKTALIDGVFKGFEGSKVTRGTVEAAYSQALTFGWLVEEEGARNSKPVIKGIPWNRAEHEAVPLLGSDE